METAPLLCEGVRIDNMIVRPIAFNAAWQAEQQEQMAHAADRRAHPVVPLRLRPARADPLPPLLLERVRRFL